jgi:hypothetical protein
MQSRWFIRAAQTAVIGFMAAEAMAQNNFPDITLPGTLPAATSVVRPMGFGAGTGAFGSSRLKHVKCADIQITVGSEKVCEVTVHVASHPLDLDKSGECLIRVKDVVQLAKNTDRVLWKLKGGGKNEFYFLDNGVVVDSNKADGDGESGDPVFSPEPVTGDRDVFKHAITKRVNRVFPYTIRLGHVYLDQTGKLTYVECAPLDPVIVNRD